MYVLLSLLARLMARSVAEPELIVTGYRPTKVLVCEAD